MGSSFGILFENSNFRKKSHLDPTSIFILYSCYFTRHRTIYTELYTIWYTHFIDEQKLKNFQYCKLRRLQGPQFAQLFWRLSLYKKSALSCLANWRYDYFALLKAYHDRVCTAFPLIFTVSNTTQSAFTSTVQYSIV